MTSLFLDVFIMIIASIPCLYKETVANLEWILLVCSMMCENKKMMMIQLSLWR